MRPQREVRGKPGTFTYIIFDEVDKGTPVDVDFKKAFDSVPYAELLIKLWV